MTDTLFKFKVPPYRSWDLSVYIYLRYDTSQFYLVIANRVNDPDCPKTLELRDEKSSITITITSKANYCILEKSQVS